MDNLSSIKEIIEEYGRYTGLTTGVSMQPMIHQGKDNIIVVKPEGRMKKYDIPVYITPQGKYIMHRVIEVHDDHYIIVGDNCLKREYVTDDMIVGQLIGYYHKGKRYIDLETNKLYKMYSRVWVALMPLRPLYMKIKHIIAKPVKAIIKKVRG